MTQLINSRLLIVVKNISLKCNLINDLIGPALVMLIKNIYIKLTSILMILMKKSRIVRQILNQW
jgi:hypothetical protein